MKSHKTERRIYYIVISFWLSAMSAAVGATPYFSMTPVYLPKQIAPGASAVASYIITNNTGLNLSKLGISNFPSTGELSQNTTPNGGAIATCGNPISLTATGAGSSCLLQINITSAIYNWRPQVCANGFPHNVYCSQPNASAALTTIIANPVVLGQKLVVANQGDSFGGTGPTSVLTFLTTDQGNVSPTYTLYGSPAFVNAVGVYVDNANHLWVVDLQGNAVYKFENASAIGNTAPVVTITGGNTGFNLPAGIAIDKAGQIYISNRGNDSILIFSQIYQQPGTYNVAPTATISGASTQLSSPLGITFDASNRLYVANTSEDHRGSPNVSIFAASATGNATPTVVLTADLVDPGAVALDVNDNLWVADYAYQSTSTSKILKYSGPVNAVEPASCTLKGQTIVGPVGLVVNTEYIWSVLDIDPGLIQQFDNPPNCNGTLDVDPINIIFGSNTTLSRSVLMAIYTG